MATIQVPGPDKKSFNKNRGISDLLQSQVKHFQHVEAKLDPALRTKFSPQDALTENDAAQYIAQMTNILRSGVSQTVDPPGPIPVTQPARPFAQPVRPTKGIPLAAMAEQTPANGKATSAPRKNKRSPAAKRETHKPRSNRP